MPNKNYAKETKRVAMIHFPDHMTEAQCNDILARMLKAGYCTKNGLGQTPTCTTYDPDMSCPTLYFP